MSHVWFALSHPLPQDRWHDKFLSARRSSLSAYQNIWNLRFTDRFMVALDISFCQQIDWNVFLLRYVVQHSFVLALDFEWETSLENGYK